MATKIASVPACAKGVSSMAETKEQKRPLSPFMIGPYYRPQMTSISKAARSVYSGGTPDGNRRRRPA